jgi:hypothetical protein
MKNTNNTEITSEAKAKCSKCGETKPLSELNGHDPVTGDMSGAYCYRLTSRKSKEPEALISNMAGWL